MAIWKSLEAETSWIKWEKKMFLVPLISVGYELVSTARGLIFKVIAEASTPSGPRDSRESVWGFAGLERSRPESWVDRGPILNGIGYGHKKLYSLFFTIKHFYFTFGTEAKKARPKSVKGTLVLSKSLSLENTWEGKILRYTKALEQKSERVEVEPVALPGPKLGLMTRMFSRQGGSASSSCLRR